MDVRKTAQGNQVGGSGVAGGAANGPPQDQQSLDVMDVGAEELRFETLRDNTRERIFKDVEEMQHSGDWLRRVHSYVKQIEEIIFRRYPNKMDYYNMSKGPIEPHVQSAVETLIELMAASTSNGTMVPAPGITRGPWSSGAAMNPLNANNMGTSLPAEMAPEPKRQRSGSASNNNLVANMVNTPGTNSIMPKPTLTPPAPVNEPKFSCPICQGELVNASSTICGHIFCQKCITTASNLQRKCPTCRRRLTTKDFHRIYLPN